MTGQDSPSLPRIAVVLPTCNVVAFLAEAIASVRAQSFEDWELLVIDDGSTDGTPEFVEALRDPRIRLIRSHHTGNPALLRNRAIDAAAGEYIAFIDSDDLWEPDKLRVQLDAMATQPDVLWSYSATTPIDESGAEVVRESAVNWRPHGGWILEALLLLEARVPASSVIVSKRALVAVGGFDPEAGPVEDYDLWFRLAQRFPALAVDRHLCRSRSRAGAYQANRIAAQRAWQRAYSTVLQAGASEPHRRICRLAIHRHRLTEALLRARAGERLRAGGLLVRSIAPGMRLRAGWRVFWETARTLAFANVVSDRAGP